jgi:hypothetical protein
MARRVFQITELRRTGAGVIDSPAVFRWTPEEHSSPVGEIPLELDVGTIRRRVPGGVEVVEQVTSVAWEPFGIRGEWNDKWLRVGTARSMFDAFRKLVERAPLVRIEFEGLSLTGLITNLRVAYRRAARIGWELTFSPHRFGAGVARVARRSVKPLGQHVAGLESGRDQLASRRAALAAVPRKNAILEALDEQVANLNSATAAASSVVTDGLLQDATGGLVQAAAAFRGIRDAAHAMALAVVRARSDVSVAFDSALENLRFAEQTKNAAAEALGLAGDSAAAERDARALARAEPQAIHRPSAGESLYAISRQYYGTSDGWRSIYLANNLTSLRLDGTEELVIPERAA